VIGILIALTLNNWNENRKSRNIESNFYAAVLDDLEKENSKIHQQIQFYNRF